jgi:hypothetical protein
MAAQQGQQPSQPAPKKPEPAPAPAQDTGSGGSPSLGKAGESSDPVVQDLLARREIAIRNEDKDGADALEKELKEHGVTV